MCVTCRAHSRCACARTSARGRSPFTLDGHTRRWPSQTRPSPLSVCRLTSLPLRTQYARNTLSFGCIRIHTTQTRVCIYIYVYVCICRVVSQTVLGSPPNHTCSLTAAKRYVRAVKGIRQRRPLRFPTGSAPSRVFRRDQSKFEFQLDSKTPSFAFVFRTSNRQTSEITCVLCVYEPGK